jgi:hypothetical protein
MAPVAISALGPFLSLAKVDNGGAVSHADVNGGGGMANLHQNYAGPLPSAPRHESPSETASASPGWGRFFTIERPPTCRCAHPSWKSRLSAAPIRHTAVQYLAAAANAFDHTVKRRVLAIDWILRITHQGVLRRHLIGAWLAVTDRCLRQQLLVRVRRWRWCGWISRGTNRLRNRHRSVDQGQQCYRRD